MSSKYCPSGTIRRRGYISHRNGKKVRIQPTCVRHRDAESWIDKEEKKFIEREKIHRRMEKKYGSKKCPVGKIERAGYTRKSYRRKGYTKRNGTYVAPTSVHASEVRPGCIIDRGRPGKGTLVFTPGKPFKIPVVLERGVLEKYGYGNIKHLSENQRHRALANAVKHMKDPLRIFRRLILLSTYDKNTDPDASNIFHNDAYWLREQFGLYRTPPHASRYRRSNGNRHKKI